MAGSAADTPATPEHLRASDEERDRAISALRQEFVEGRLSHETFMFRMQSALGARHRGQLTGLFTDLPPRRPKLLDRIRAVFRRQDPPDGTERDWHREPQPPPGMWAPPSVAHVAGWPPQSARWSGAHGPGDPGRPAPMVFPPGQGTSFTIGRTQDCDLRIADPSVSRHHAQLDRSEEGWLLSDLGSHNGTRVNGWLVREPVPVRPGDILQFGSATFVIQAPPGPDRPPVSAGPQRHPEPPAGAGPQQDPQPPATAAPQQEPPDRAVSAGPQQERPDLL
jgi:FHA domain-containing protein/uncharacterized protein DUF1707